MLGKMEQSGKVDERETEREKERERIEAYIDIWIIMNRSSRVRISFIHDAHFSGISYAQQSSNQTQQHWIYIIYWLTLVLRMCDAIDAPFM